MSTNSTIAVFNEWGDVRSVYCHWDGYVEWNGKMLDLHFNSLNKALALVDGGDISAINEGGVVDYYKDKGDDWESVKPEVYNNIEELMEEMKYSTNIEFVYVYVNGLGWTVRDVNNEKSGLLSDFLKEIEKVA